MTQYELESRWVTAEGVPGVSYRFSDLVRLKSGEYAGHIAEVIALISLEPEPMYVVDFRPNDKSVVVPQSQLDPTGSTAGRTLELVKTP